MPLNMDAHEQHWSVSNGLLIASEVNDKGKGETLRFHLTDERVKHPGMNSP